MRNIILSLLFVSAPAFAKGACWVDGYEKGLGTKIENMVFARATKVLEARGISVNPNSERYLSDFQTSGTNDDPITYLDIKEAFISSADGTVFQLDTHLPAYFSNVLVSAGFDREGNPINGHCFITGSSATDVDILNYKTGVKLGRFRLPNKFQVY